MKNQIKQVKARATQKWKKINIKASIQFILAILIDLPAYLAWLLEALSLAIAIIILINAALHTVEGELLTATWMIGIILLLIGVNIAASYYTSTHQKGGVS